jgi:hypothetical protein
MNRKELQLVNMELHEFIEKFLPDYEEKASEYLTDKKDISKGFIVLFFNEALQNYTNKICEKQIENCHAKATEWDLSVTVENAILKANKPKIEDLVCGN